MQEKFVDIFNYEHDVCDLKQGWTNVARRNLFMASINVRLLSGTKRIPKLTKVGYSVQAIPDEAFQKIFAHYKEANFKTGSIFSLHL